LATLSLKKSVQRNNIDNAGENENHSSKIYLSANKFANSIRDFDRLLQIYQRHEFVQE
jgi:hypothetical protein